MDIYDADTLRRPVSFPLNLKRLPTELVHQVIEELPLIKILQILAHKNPHLNDCVLYHNGWRKLFTKPEDIAAVVDIFILYTEICRFTRASISEPGTVLALGSGSARFGRDMNAPRLGRYFHSKTQSALPSKSWEIAMLEVNASTAYPGDAADIEIRWEWFKEAKFSLNKAKCQQLELAADILARFPGKLMVKRPLDPHQGAPRKNLKHIENALRLRAQKALKDPRLIYPAWIQSLRCRDAVDNIELVPYNRYLWFFLDTLEKYPFSEANALEDAIVKLSISSQTGLLKPPVYNYPPEILTDIETILKGISFLYTGSPLLVIERVNWEGNRYDTGPYAKKPRFYRQICAHASDLPEEVHRCRMSKVMTYDEREYVWLLSFLTVVDWMEKEFGAVPVPLEQG